MKELELKVKGMSCEGCENRIKNVLLEIPNVKSVMASHDTGIVKIIFKKEERETIQNEIKSRIERLGYSVC